MICQQRASAQELSLRSLALQVASSAGAGPGAATSFNGADRWVGLMARYETDDNSLYVTLRSSNVLSLRQLVSGQIQVLAEQPRPTSTISWHTNHKPGFADEPRAPVNTAHAAPENSGMLPLPVNLTPVTA